MKYASKTIQYSIYDRTNGGSEYVGDTSSYTRPEVEYLADTIKGTGLMGEIELPTSGQIGAMSIELSFNKTNKKFTELLAPKSHKIEVRWATDVLNSSTGATEVEANKEIVTFVPKTGSLGDIESNETNEATLNGEVLYYQYIINGESVIEIDKLNMILKVNGVDYSEAIRNAL